MGICRVTRVFRELREGAAAAAWKSRMVVREGWGRGLKAAGPIF